MCITDNIGRYALIDSHGKHYLVKRRDDAFYTQIPLWCFWTKEGLLVTTYLCSCICKLTSTAATRFSVHVCSISGVILSLNMVAIFTNEENQQCKAKCGCKTRGGGGKKCTSI